MLLQSFKTFTVSPSLASGSYLVLSLVLLLGTILPLIYDGYVKEKRTHGVRNPVRLFEWFYEKTEGVSSCNKR
jgi:hypothetical protein